MGCQWKAYLYTCFSSLCSTTEWIAVKFRTYIHVPLRRTFTNPNVNYLPFFFYHFLLPNRMKWACRRMLQPWPKVTTKPDLSIKTNKQPRHWSNTTKETGNKTLFPSDHVHQVSSWCWPVQSKTRPVNTLNWEHERGKHYGCMLLLWAR